MPRQPRQPHTRSVKTPEALAALRDWLLGWPDHIRERGENYYREGRVEQVWSNADHFVEARVRGGEPYHVTLFFTRGAWSARCTCPVGIDCKHGYAAALAWMDYAVSGRPDGADPDAASRASARAAAELVAAPEGTTSSRRAGQTGAAFRAEWTPVLMSKLGRSLTADELRQLENLGALYAEFAQANGTLYPGAVIRHGFEYTPPASAPLYAPALSGQWDDGTAPKDPWELWQYLAADYERHGRAIPALFQPMTNTAGLRDTIDQRVRARELSAWHRALAAAEVPEQAWRAAGPASIAGLRARVRTDGSVFVESRAGPGELWKLASARTLAALRASRPVDFEALTPPEAALASALAAEARDPTREGVRNPLSPEIVSVLFRMRAAAGAIVGPDGGPLRIEPEPLVLAAENAEHNEGHLRLRLAAPDGRNATGAQLITAVPKPLYVFDGRLWHGPPPLPEAPLPLAALDDAKLMSRLRRAGLRLPPALERNLRQVTLWPHVKCWLAPAPGDDESMLFQAELLARADEVPCEQRWTRAGWEWTATGAPPPRGPDDPLLEFDASRAEAVAARFPAFQLEWQAWDGRWARPVTKTFPEEFIAWRESIPAGVPFDAAPGLANLLGPPLRAQVEFGAKPAGAAGRDWFDLTVKLRVADTKFTQEELALLLRARGKWVRLPKHGWQRIELDENDPERREAAQAMDRLGLDFSDLLTDGRPSVHRIHALQLASEAEMLERRDAKLAAALRTRAQDLRAVPPPPLPAGLQATLRPYQIEGFRFLAHLSALGLGGVLADDMGLGKTVQTLAWLLDLAEAANRPEPPATGSLAAASTPAGDAFRVLVVCPKSVVHGWITETNRFAPSLGARVFDPLHRGAASGGGERQLVVANYTQLRLHADWFRQRTWDAVVLDEGQFIKNPGSQVAIAARSLNSARRLVLTGTPIENRLTDLWSLFAFAQPGLLGTQAAFRRQYAQVDAAALARLHRRIQHFLLRRTKKQAAPELPPRTEDDILVELEGEQRRLYDAELKRARAQLLGVETNEALASIRFNVLSGLLRLRQICCHPGLVDPAHRDLPSAKLEALLEQLEELRDEGHQVLVFSQFVGMLEIIRARLLKLGIGHLMLTGQTENRAELVDTFQRDRSQTVFLLSLKAAGFGLNLTAASYAILYDPWWNPAAEAQAIDRTHRIGQTQPVVAYRLLAENTVEEKIRAMQRDKASLAAAVIQEESLAQVLDLDSLRTILA